MQHLIAGYVAGITIGNPQSYENLTVFPLESDCRLELDYLTLDEALEADLIEVVEKNAQGSVPELRVINKSDALILILEGEELVGGGEQNRFARMLRASQRARFRG